MLHFKYCEKKTKKNNKNKERGVVSARDCATLLLVPSTLYAIVKL